MFKEFYENSFHC